MAVKLCLHACVLVVVVITLCQCLHILALLIMSLSYVVDLYSVYLGEEIPAHQALRAHVDLSLGLSLIHI